MANRDAPNTTIVESKGNSGTIVIGIVLLIAVLIGGYFLLNQSRNDNARTDAVTRAADKAGDSAAKVGDAADKAVKDATH